jgi:hypothetical protein
MPDQMNVNAYVEAAADASDRSRWTILDLGTDEAWKQEAKDLGLGS